MKDVRGRILKKLKSFPQVAYLKPDLYHRALASNVFAQPSPPPPTGPCRARSGTPEHGIGPIDPAELTTGVRDEYSGRAQNQDDKENVRPPSPQLPPRPRKVVTSSDTLRKEVEQEEEGGGVALRENGDHNAELDAQHRYRRPDLNSWTLFDPELLAAFEQAVMNYVIGLEEAKRSRAREDREVEEPPPSKVPRTEPACAYPLLGFEDKCPPGGRERVVLYTTTLRGIRKTFEDCNSVRFLLERLKVAFCERDVSMHMEFREELWRALECRAIPPRLFVKGRYIGGADEVLGLHEQGRLLPLLRGDQAADTTSGGEPCEGCGGVRFVMCSECSGSRRVFDGENAASIRCRRCNENGLVVCSICF